MEHKFFHRLVSLPLFQGLSQSDFINIAESVRIDFRTLSPGAVIVCENEKCEGLFFVVNGTAIIEKQAHDHSYQIREWINSPITIQPERLFGLCPRYNATYRADSEVQLLMITKDQVRDTLFRYATFHINYLNLLCMDNQRAEIKFWKKCPENLIHRFVYFLSMRCYRPAGRKELRTGMETLADELMATRRNVSAMLHELDNLSLIELRRERICVPRMEALIHYVQEH